MSATEARNRLVRDLLARYERACDLQVSVDDAAVERAIKLHFAALGVPFKDLVKIESLHDFSQAAWGPHRGKRSNNNAHWNRSIIRAGLRSENFWDALNALEALATGAGRLNFDVDHSPLDVRTALDTLDVKKTWRTIPARAARAYRRRSMVNSALNAFQVAGNWRNRRTLSASDTWEAFQSWDASWAASLFIGAIHVEETRVVEAFGPIFHAFESGMWLYVYLEDDVFCWVPHPQVHRQDNRLHHEAAPAFVLPQQKLYFWQGVMVPEKVIVNPAALTKEEVLSERNAEVRRIMLQRLGPRRVKHLFRPEVLDRSAAHGNLLMLDVASFQMPFAALEVTCPSTGRQYLIPVPPDMETAHQARAWTFGMTAEEFQPLVET